MSIEEPPLSLHECKECGAAQECDAYRRGWDNATDRAIRKFHSVLFADSMRRACALEDELKGALRG